MRVGVLSAAHVHSTEYARVLAERDAVEFVGIVDEDGDRGRQLANQYDTEYVAAADADAFLDRIDAAIVCSPNVDHAGWIERAADHGVHVLCEKPLATTVTAAESIIDIWETATVRIGVAMPLRFSAAAERAMERLDTIGEIHSISGTNRGRMPGGWFVDPDRSGGGAVMDHTVHLVDLVYHLTGATVAEVYAEVGTRIHDIPTDDVNVLLMELSDGTSFLLDGSWSKPTEWHTWGDATVEFVGTEGAISLDCTGRRVWHTRDDTGVRSSGVDIDTTTAMVDDFLAAIEEEREPMTTPDDGLLAVAAVEAAYESAETGVPVELDI